MPAPTGRITRFMKGNPFTNSNCLGDCLIVVRLCGHIQGIVRGTGQHISHDFSDLPRYNVTGTATLPLLGDIPRD